MVITYNLQMHIIAIAGGSGSGKSTIAYKLEDAYPQIFEVLNLDDYQKLEGLEKLTKTLRKNKLGPSKHYQLGKSLKRYINFAKRRRRNN